jgi:hypothetical protein
MGSGTSTRSISGGLDHIDTHRAGDGFFGRGSDCGVATSDVQTVLRFRQDPDVGVGAVDQRKALWVLGGGGVFDVPSAPSSVWNRCEITSPRGTPPFCLPNRTRLLGYGPACCFENIP